MIFFIIPLPISFIIRCNDIWINGINKIIFVPIFHDFCQEAMSAMKYGSLITFFGPVQPKCMKLVTFFSAITSDSVYLEMIFRLKIFISKNYNVSNLWSIPFIFRKLVLNFMLWWLDEVKNTHIFCFSLNDLEC